MDRLTEQSLRHDKSCHLPLHKAGFYADCVNCIARVIDIDCCNIKGIHIFMCHPERSAIARSRTRRAMRQHREIVRIKIQ